MPKIRRQRLPPALLNHLLDRMNERQISVAQLGLVADWLALNPEVPIEKWFKRFPGVTICGEGEFIKTFLLPGQAVQGVELT
jgi:hypothetical protein